MGKRILEFSSIGLLIALMVGVMPGRADAQPPFDSLTLAQGKPASTQRGWKQPMTPWGEPDLRGIWPFCLW